MVKGALLELSARGSQDVVLTRNPDINFFKGVYKRNVDFSIQNILVNFNEAVDFDNLLTVIIPKKGDLLGGIHLHLTLPILSVAVGSTYTGWTNSVGHAIIDYIEIWIGGIKIDKQYGLWMEIWDELVLSESYRAGKKIAIGQFDDVADTKTNATVITDYYIPFPFWFNRRKSLALPLVALQYHQIELKIKLKSFIDCVTFDGGTDPSVVSIIKGELIMEYYYLEDEQRKIFAQNDHMYLYEMLQFSEVDFITATNAQGSTHRSKLEFNHSLKNLVWIFTEEASIQNNDWFNFSRRADNTKLVNSTRLLLDGDEREEKFEEGYHRLVQSMLHHTRVPNKFIYSLNFALYPESEEPSGSLNVSRFDSVIMEFGIRENNPSCFLYVWSINWNILVITKGMASRLFSS